MSTINLTNAPFIDKNFVVSGAFGEERSGGRIHRGLDLAPIGYTGSLYAIDDFTIIYRNYDASGYGYYFIATNGNGMMYLYAHMQGQAPSVGTHIPIHGYVGECGNSGPSGTGWHVHIEMQSGTTWRYQQPLSVYTNPCSYLTGINNVTNYSQYYYYDGSPTPPTPSRNNKRFNWILFNKRNKRLSQK